MMSTLKNDRTATEVPLGKNTLDAHIINKKTEDCFPAPGFIAFCNGNEKLLVPQLSEYCEKAQRLKMSDFKYFFFNKINLNRIA